MQRGNLNQYIDNDTMADWVREMIPCQIWLQLLRSVMLTHDLLPQATKTQILVSVEPIYCNFLCGFAVYPIKHKQQAYAQ